ncbi:ligase-associated DNA damage response endonuclease PdeM [Rubellimicrobium aerolatum]|uniref:Ligase-associated DNA damage response endonuclease PdeM n=1 Tax=Rubellimicrobium aerolatum TaxID=490979 RepID=A0ABW0SFK9_9RHOB|nr:ligase-associated DNA damage response endonuclease PdeM [Rubellimicrobium aerolatum]MBP1807129.1 DNA ligase-associated metallophosphoesterase [Rubellimicrobium aerolatum]
MNGTAFSFTLNGTHGLALPSGALLLPKHELLCVSDLHMAKSERMARRRGLLLPPYETRATLDRLSQDIATAKPACVVALGDSFDDLAASEALDPEDRARLLALQDGRRWVWIEGNHDAGLNAHGGEGRESLTVGGLTFRHIAEADAAPGEVSGHYHPKHGLPGFGERCPCFLLDSRRLVMPAYGTYTGGLDAREPVLRGLFGGQALAVLTGPRALAVPLPPARRLSREA